MTLMSRWSLKEVLMWYELVCKLWCPYFHYCYLKLFNCLHFCHFFIFLLFQGTAVWPCSVLVAVPFCHHNFVDQYLSYDMDLLHNYDGIYVIKEVSEGSSFRCWIFVIGETVGCFLCFEIFSRCYIVEFRKWLHNS